MNRSERTQLGMCACFARSPATQRLIVQSPATRHESALANAGRIVFVPAGAPASTGHPCARESRTAAAYPVEQLLERFADVSAELSEAVGDLGRGRRLDLAPDQGVLHQRTPG